MKNIFNILIICTTILACSPVYAQGKRHHRDKADREAWMQKMKEFKHSFLISELKLEDNQVDEFFEIYDARESERMAIEGRIRKMEREIDKKIENNTITERELEECIEEQYDSKEELAEIDERYEDEFSRVLSKTQHFKLPRVERKFNRELMKRRHGTQQSSKP